MHTNKKNTIPQKVKIHSQGHKTLMYGIKVHVGPKAQIHMDKRKPNHEKKKSSPKDTTLMYGT
jgi:nitrous oxide reductase accessory protein NosL